MKWIGITGGIAMGKSRVSQILVENGFDVLFADKIVHELLGPHGQAVARVAQVFGRDLVNPDQGVDRKKLGKIVFRDPGKLRTLENLLHPLVQAEVKRKKEDMERQGVQFAFYEIPLLFEKNLDEQFDEIVVVATRPDVQMKRLSQRDQLSPTEIAQRLSQQIPIEQKIAQADTVIRNDGSEEDLRLEVQTKIVFRLHQAQT